MQWKLMVLFIVSCLLSIITADENPGSGHTLIILDPGHTQKHPGAISITFIPEVQYNDLLCALVSKQIKRDSFDFYITRQSGEEISLGKRVTRSNALDALAFISIHHDSAQPLHLEKTQVGGNSVYRTLNPIRGYSIFVSAENCQYHKSLKLAQCIGEQLLSLGRKPTMHHAEPIEGENRELIDKRLGVYKYNGLKVLKSSIHPAVLIEVGVIVDKEDESFVADSTNQKLFASALSNALNDFWNIEKKSAFSRKN